MKLTIDELELIVKALGCLAGVEEFNGKEGAYINRIDDLKETISLEAEYEKEQS